MSKVLHRSWKAIRIALFVSLSMGRVARASCKFCSKEQIALRNSSSAVCGVSEHTRRHNLFEHTKGCVEKRSGIQ
eukprot:805893-Rhodomonas_salina.1